ncbi:MAG TPA: coagulation factor 5/8 type domain-containing protein [Terracidiphilus sp.]|jgi:hypothetical protein
MWLVRILARAALVSGVGFVWYSPVFSQATPAQTPDLGGNVLVFSPAMPAAEMQKKIDDIYAAQEHSEFGARRDAILLLPGEYHLDIPVGFYTQVIGLGPTPDAVHVTGNVHSDASLPRNNATCTFWRGVEGFSVTPTIEGTMQWAVSQAVFFRRMHVQGNLVLHQKHGWASGGWISDSVIDGNVDSGSQQQWLSRNTEWKSWTGSNWNMVFVGINHPPEGEWPAPPYTKVEKTPVVREKPFLWVDEKGRWSVRVPGLTSDSTGITWHGGNTAGKDVALAQFYIAKPGDTAAAINTELARGKDLLLTPGIYELSEPIKVTRSNTVVLGLGFATLRPVKGTAALTTADADGIIVAGVLIDAGETKSPVLMEIGAEGSKASHAKNPISLHDVFFRVGGAGVGKADVNLRVNANDTIIDHTWIWRADHGKGVGWDQNLSNNGLVVNGDRVTAYGLFVEHHQQYQVLWNGEAGRTYFYQSEIPYDPPTQPAFTSGAGVNGWASYKVADGVKTHEAWGLGIYSVFRHPDVTLTRAIEVPTKPGVRFHHMMTIALDDKGEITHVIDDKGGAAVPGAHRTTPRVTDFP